MTFLGYPRSPSERRRGRASSRAESIPSDPLLHPPMPPYAAGPRSASSTSISSTHLPQRTSSDQSSSAKSSSSTAIRSSSGASGIDSGRPPPSAYPYSASSETAPKSSLNFFSGGVDVATSPIEQSSTTMSRSSSLTRGFHLPSPSPKSPYNVASVGLGLPSLPHSTSFPSQIALEAQKRSSDSETETEAEGNGQTPKRRKKIRPVSAMPAPRMGSGWAGDGWKGFAAAPNAPSIPVAGIEGGNSPNLPGSSTAESVPFPSTLKKIGNLSVQHGRRLSGGWMFGSSGSSSSESKPSKIALDTVVGSPSKPGQVTGLNRTQVNGGATDPLRPDDEARDILRGDTTSAHNSRMPNDLIGHLPSHVSETAIKDTANAEMRRRRQSWNDFVIPRGVLEKQKELKQGIGAVKQFASGVECK